MPITINSLKRAAAMAPPFIVFYRHHGEDYSAPFDTMRRARQFARLTGGRIESRLSGLLT